MITLPETSLSDCGKYYISKPVIVFQDDRQPVIARYQHSLPFSPEPVQWSNWCEPYSYLIKGHITGWMYIPDSKDMIELASS